MKAETLHVEKVQSALELVVAQTQVKNMEADKEKKRKTAGWSKKDVGGGCKQAGAQGHGGNDAV